MCGKAILGDFVHTLGANLHFHPFLLGTKDGDVEAFVTIALGHGQPVAQPSQVALVFGSDDGEYFPALCLLLLQGCIEDDADGEEVVHAVEAATLLLHFLPDGVDTLRAPLDVVVQALGIEHLANGLNEAGDVGIAAFLGGVEAILDKVVGIVLQVFQREVLQFAFQLVESQFVRQRSIYISGLGRYIAACGLVFAVLDLAHLHDASRNEQQHHAHIARLTDEQVAEIVRAHRFHLGFERLHAAQRFDGGQYFGAEFSGHRAPVIALIGLRHQVSC